MVADQATLFVSSLDSRCVESLEEPLALPETDTLAALQARTDVSLALDESLPAFLENHSMDRLPVRRIVIKPSVLGGIMPSASLRREADRAGIESVVTSTLESNVGILAAAHLAAATDGDRPAVHGLATGKWFTRNTAPPPGIHAGMLRLPGGPGLGLAAPR